MSRFAEEVSRKAGCHDTRSAETLILPFLGTFVNLIAGNSMATPLSLSLTGIGDEYNPPVPSRVAAAGTAGCGAKPHAAWAFVYSGGYHIGSLAPSDHTMPLLSHQLFRLGCNAAETMMSSGGQP